MSQTKEILQALELRPLTAIDALKKFNCFRLAARIKDLRDEGHTIITEKVNRNGKSFARYRLVKMRREA